MATKKSDAGGKSTAGKATGTKAAAATKAAPAKSTAAKPAPAKDADDLGAQFEAAAAKAMKLPEKPDNDTLLKLYALYKQGSQGDVSGAKPGFFDFVATAKYEAWAKLKGVSRDEARKKYVDLVKRLS